MKLSILPLILTPTILGIARVALSQSVRGDLPGASQAPLATKPASATDFSRERDAITAAQAALKSSDLATARKKAAEAIEALLARPIAEQDEQWQKLLVSAGRAAFAAQDARTARSAYERVLDIRSHTLPDDHPDLLDIQMRYAVALWSLGDLPAARALQEKVLQVRERTLPDSDIELARARLGLANTLHLQGEFVRARALQEKVVDVYSRKLPDDHIDLAGARANLAATLEELGQDAAALTLREKVFEVCSRTLPKDHPELARASFNLANALRHHRDFARARDLGEKVLEVRARTLPAEHPDLAKARTALASTLMEQGDLSAARALQEQALESCTRALPDEHPLLATVRGNLAVTLYKLGDYAASRPLLEKVLEVLSRTMPDDNPSLMQARNGLAELLRSQGDLESARALLETAIEVSARTLPAEHPSVITSRRTLATVLWGLGDNAGARALQEEILEIYSHTLPDDDFDVQEVRSALALTLWNQGDLAGARSLLEAVDAVYGRALPVESTQRTPTRVNLALTIMAEHARAAFGNKDAGGGAQEAARTACLPLNLAMCNAETRAARTAYASSPAREAEERCARLSDRLDYALSFVRGCGVLGPSPELSASAFELAQATRGAAMAASRSARRAASAPRYSELRQALRDASSELAALARKGGTSEAFDAARVKRESAERALIAAARELTIDAAPGVDVTVNALARALGEDASAVAFRRYGGLDARVSAGAHAEDPVLVRLATTARMCALVVRGEPAESASPAAIFVDLGPLEAIERAVREWREAIGPSAGRGLTASSSAAVRDSRSIGAKLRSLVLDPVLKVCAGKKRMVLELDDMLHLVTIDALPVDDDAPSRDDDAPSRDGDAGALVGDRWTVEYRSAIGELLDGGTAPAAEGGLVAVGGASFDALAPGAPSAGASSAAAEVAVVLRGGSWSGGFSALPGTRDEARGIGQSYADAFGADASIAVLEDAGASKARLLALAPDARFLHIATHGWFAPDSMRSWSDPAPIDERSGLARMSGEEQVKGMSPMLLCGLALAGADLPEDELGRAPGLITADEIAALDLSRCELAVLSACDTNVGERRAGQGVASLQKALQMAGARSVITSLWKVPDEATKELMLDFYRRLWVEKKPKWQALWEAKKMMREAKDERGQLKYTTRDWAAWVLTGEPN